MTNARTAELCKLAENTFRDINIAYANELALICEKSCINVWEAINLCNNHPRVNIHQPGPGVGGHCIAVDPWFIVEKQPQTAQLIHQARLINDRMPEIVAQKIIDMVQDKDKPQVTILGVTYKPNVDDTRESPILTLISQLAKTNIQVLAQDPFAANYQGDIYQAATGSDLVVLGVCLLYTSVTFSLLAVSTRSTRKIKLTTTDTRAAKKVPIIYRIIIDLIFVFCPC